MADEKLTAKAAITTPTDDDIMYVVDDPGGTPASKKITWSNVKATLLTYFDTQYAASGWKEVSGTWTYASASTITVPSDATTTYQKGDYVRFKQGAGYKYYVIASVAATVVTVFVNTDYTVANAAITDIAYSRAANPFGFPHWFTRTTTDIIVGSGGSKGTYAQSAASKFVYKVEGSSITESVFAVITNKGSWSGDLRLSTLATISSAEPMSTTTGNVFTGGTITTTGIPYPITGSAYLLFITAVGVSNLQWSAVAVNDEVHMRFVYRY